MSAPDFSNVKSFLLDIEGTTTSISFVKDVLFPYVRKNLAEFVKEKFEDGEFKKAVVLLKEQAAKDKEDQVEGLIEIGDDQESVVKNVEWQMDNDRKTTGLKSLQGLIWRQAYESGQVKGHVYPDVVECLRDWSLKRKVFIYSSGSVDAQKLLFAHSDAGDLTSHLSGYFDTVIGAKTEQESYTKIAKELDNDPSQVLFLTDVLKEAEAAHGAGLQVLLVVREGNAPLSEAETVKYQTISSFTDIELQPCAKRAKKATDAPPPAAPVETPVATEAPAPDDEPMEVTEDKDTVESTEKNEEMAVITESSKAIEEVTEEVAKVTEEVALITEEVAKTAEVATVTGVAIVTEDVPKVTEVATVTEEVALCTEDVPKVAEVASVTDEVAKVTEEVVKVTEEVVKEIDEVTKVSEEVAKVTDEVVQVTEEVVKVIDEVTKVSEEVSKVTEEVIKATEELKDKTEKPIEVSEETIEVVADKVEKVSEVTETSEVASEKEIVPEEKSNGTNVAVGNGTAEVVVGNGTTNGAESANGTNGVKENEDECPKTVNGITEEDPVAALKAEAKKVEEQNEAPPAVVVAAE